MAPPNTVEISYSQLVGTNSRGNFKITIERDKFFRLTRECFGRREELIKYIVIYLRQMADGELADAEATERKIIPDGKQTRSMLSEMAQSDRPEPELADIAEKVLQGLIRGLNAKVT